MANVGEKEHINVLDRYYISLYEDIVNDLELNETVLKNHGKNKFFSFSHVSKDKVKEAIKVFEQLELRLSDVNLLNTTSSDNKLFRDKISEVVKCNPRDIPLQLLDSSSLIGKYRPTYGKIDKYDMSDSYYNSSIMNAITSIGIEKNPANVAQSFYNNQIMKTQLDLLDSYVCEDVDRDVLPIFIEQLTAYMNDKETFKQVRYARLYDLADTINTLRINSTDKSDTLNKYKFISSSLKAFRLLDIYINGDAVKRDLIHYYILSIMNGQVDLYWLLNRFKIEIDNSEKDYKTLKKF